MTFAPISVISPISSASRPCHVPDLLSLRRWVGQPLKSTLTQRPTPRCPRLGSISVKNSTRAPRTAATRNQRGVTPPMPGSCLDLEHDRLRSRLLSPLICAKPRDHNKIQPLARLDDR